MLLPSYVPSQNAMLSGGGNGDNDNDNNRRLLGLRRMLGQKDGEQRRARMNALTGVSPPHPPCVASPTMR